jgi:hypothetical protein
MNEIPFDSKNCSFEFNLGLFSAIESIKVSSYSGNYWNKELIIDGESTDPKTIYNISKFVRADEYNKAGVLLSLEYHRKLNNDETKNSELIELSWRKQRDKNMFPSC